MYRKVTPNHPSYDRIQAVKQSGQWICDAVTHNSPRGCSNPNCFNYKHSTPAHWLEFDNSLKVYFPWLENK